MSIASGIAAALSVFFPPAAVLAGVGSIANGILTQEGLNALNPLLQWTEVWGTLGNLTRTAVTFLDEYWVQVLGSTPNATNSDEISYDLDPIQLPSILAPGGITDSAAAVSETFMICPAFSGWVINGENGTLASKHQFASLTLERTLPVTE